MNDARISQLNLAYPLSGEEYIPITQLINDVLTTVATTPNNFIDFIRKNLELIPVGVVSTYAAPLNGLIQPAGWLVCDGRSVLKDEYKNLYDVIGSTYGSDNATTFKLPDLRGRVVLGYNVTSGSYVPNFGNWNTNNILQLGQYGGEFEHKLTASESPTKTININATTDEVLDVIQTITWKTAIDGSDFFAWQDNNLTITHRNWQGPGKTTVDYKTVNANTNAIINQGTYTTPGGTGSFTLPFNVIKTTDVVLTKLTGRATVTMTEQPTSTNNYKTVVLFNDDGPGANAWYSATLTLKSTIVNLTTPVATASNTNIPHNIVQPYTCLNYIIKY